MSGLQGHVRLTDLGLGAKIEGDAVLTQHCGTRSYMGESLSSCANFFSSCSTECPPQLQNRPLAQEGTDSVLIGGVWALLCIIS